MMKLIEAIRAKEIVRFCGERGLVATSEQRFDDLLEAMLSARRKT